MSNTLYITVGEFKPFGQFGDSREVLVVAGDSYGNDTLHFDDLEHLRACYPTQGDLIRAVLELPTFEGVVSFKEDGSYELDAANHIFVQGYPE